MLGIQDRRRVIICIFPSCQIHTHKRRLPQRTERYLHSTYLDSNRIATTVSFAQWIRNLLAKIIKCQSPPKSSPPCLQMHSVTNAAPNRMCKFIGHHQETCPCILFFYPVPVSTPFLQTKIGRMVFFAICIAINQCLVLNITYLYLNSKKVGFYHAHKFLFRVLEECHNCKLLDK